MRTAKRTHHFLKILIYTGIVASFGILISLGWISVEASRSFKEASYWRTHSAEVISKLNRIMGQVLESESGQRGYMLTGDPRFLKAHEEAKAEMPAELHELSMAVKDNWEQSIRVEQMGSLIRGFGGYLSDTIRQYDRGDKKAASIRVQKGEGLAYSQRLRELYLEFLNDEERLLAARTQDYERKARRLELFIKYAVTGSILLLLISVMFWGVKIHAAERSKKSW